MPTVSVLKLLTGSAERWALHVGHHQGLHPAPALAEPDDRSLVRRPAAPLPFLPAAEIRLVDLDISRQPREKRIRGDCRPDGHEQLPGRLVPDCEFPREPLDRDSDPEQPDGQHSLRQGRPGLGEDRPGRVREVMPTPAAAVVDVAALGHPPDPPTITGRAPNPPRPAELSPASLTGAFARNELSIRIQAHSGPSGLAPL
jgi:hypothetical protein